MKGKMRIQIGIRLGEGKGVENGEKIFLRKKELSKDYGDYERL